MKSEGESCKLAYLGGSFGGNSSEKGDRFELSHACRVAEGAIKKRESKKNSLMYVWSNS
jgi:hypothetical protein